MRILDMTASVRSMWYQKNHKSVVFMDQRNGTFINPLNTFGKQKAIIKPTIQASWEKMPFKEGVFSMVVWDPPHIDSKKCGYANEYGFLIKSWREQFRVSFEEAKRVTIDKGFIVFKWNEATAPLDDVLNCFSLVPLFGNRTGTSQTTAWIVFLVERHVKHFIR